MNTYNRLIRHSGNEDLFRAVTLSAAAMTGRHPFHIHAEGLRGTGKTTILRAAGRMLPPIVRVRDCVYNCHPDRPHCPRHRGLDAEEIARLGREVVPCPFLEISHSAKVGTVLGSIDLGKLIDRGAPAAALLPGTILQAHRGVVFVDEINRLADTSPELADVLLDVMGTKPGRVQVEETGLPVVEMPVEVTVWAASNPDEEPGALAQVRKQLADRFDLAVTMGRPSEADAVVAILAGREGSAASCGDAVFPTEDFRHVAVADDVRNVLAAVYIDFGLESLRAVEGMETAARLAAVHAGRRQTLLQDVAAVAPLVLSHRTDAATLAGIMKYLQAAGCSRDVRAAAGDTVPSEDGRPAEGAEARRGSRWSEWWEDLKRRLGARRPRNGQGEQGGDSKSQGERRSASSAVADPTTVPMTAPPRPALPLAQLPPERFVGGEDGKGNG